MHYDQYVIVDVAQLRRGDGSRRANIPGFKNATNSSNYRYIRLTDANINSFNSQLVHLTCKSKIIIIGHGSPGARTISSDDASSHITANQLARFIVSNIDKNNTKPIIAYTDLGKNAALANSSDKIFYPEGDKELRRRLTFQLCVCHAADNKDTQVSYLESFYQELRIAGVDANVVGYRSTVRANFTDDNDLLAGRMMFGVVGRPENNLDKIYPAGDGRAYDKENRRALKVIFNNDHPRGKLYDKDWKEVLRADILDQLNHEINKGIWQQKGLGFLTFGTKVPEGIRLMRARFERERWPIPPDEHMRYSRLTKDIYEILRARLATTYKVTTRDPATTELYKKYFNALEMCI